MCAASLRRFRAYGLDNAMKGHHRHPYGSSKASFAPSIASFRDTVPFRGKVLMQSIELKERCTEKPTGADSRSFHINRRRSLYQLPLILFANMIASNGPSKASLIQYPAKQLNNTYILIRAGMSKAEEGGHVLTNPVAKTSMSNGLGMVGKRQVLEQTLPSLIDRNICSEGCWIWPGMALNSYQTAETVAERFGVGRNRIVPEFSKLDARGTGALEGGDVAVVRDEISIGDAVSPDWRPPPGVDGTPNESVSDVATRGRELLSLLETQYAGSEILLISPDSDNLSVLQASVLGVDLRDHRRFKFAPGEVRYLELSSMEPDYSSVVIPCPRPPICK